MLKNKIDRMDLMDDGLDDIQRLVKEGYNKKLDD